MGTGTLESGEPVGKEFVPCLVVKFKIIKLSHQKRILHAWSIKSRRNKKRIAWFAYKLRDESNEHNRL